MRRSRAVARESNNMGTLSKEAIELLERLLSVCKDGQEGFRCASADATTPELKQRLMQFSEQRSEFATELRRIADELGGLELEEHSTMVGDLHRAWLNMRTVLAVQDDQSVLTECARGEEHALDVYQQVLANPDLPSEMRGTVEQQRTAIQQAYAFIKAGSGDPAARSDS